MFSTDIIENCKHFDPAVFSDLYKDAHGFRPRFSLSGKTSEELDELWLATERALEREMEWAAEREQIGKQRLTADIDALAAEHGIGRRDALRWIMQAHGLTEGDEGVEEVVAIYGAPYAMAAELRGEG